MASAAVRACVAQAFAEVPDLPAPVAETRGSWSRIAALGFEGFALSGTHRFQHTPADDARTTAPALLAPVAAATWRALQAIEARSAGPAPTQPA